MLTELTADKFVEMMENAAKEQGLGLEDCTLFIRANHRENSYDSEEQINVECGEYGHMTIDLLEDWMVENNP